MEFVQDVMHQDVGARSRLLGDMGVLVTQLYSDVQGFLCARLMTAAAVPNYRLSQQQS